MHAGGQEDEMKASWEIVSGIKHSNHIDDGSITKEPDQQRKLFDTLRAGQTSKLTGKRMPPVLPSAPPTAPTPTPASAAASGSGGHQGEANEASSDDDGDVGFPSGLMDVLDTGLSSTPDAKAKTKTASGKSGSSRKTPSTRSAAAASLRPSQSSGGAGKAESRSAVRDACFRYLGRQWVGQGLCNGYSQVLKRLPTLTWVSLRLQRCSETKVLYGPAFELSQASPPCPGARPKARSGVVTMPPPLRGAASGNGATKRASGAAAAAPLPTGDGAAGKIERLGVFGKPIVSARAE